MTSLDNGGPLDQLLAKARELSKEAPEVRRKLVIDFVMGRLELSGTREKVTRFMVERVYDKIFGTPEFIEDRQPTADSRQSSCSHCGLNDGHHYVGCRALEK